MEMAMTIMKHPVIPMDGAAIDIARPCHHSCKQWNEMLQKKHLRFVFASFSIKLYGPVAI
jgi:hypothetical protein